MRGSRKKTPTSVKPGLEVWQGLVEMEREGNQGERTMSAEV